MTTDIVNGHRFATTSTAGGCRNNCGWTWFENDTWEMNNTWKLDEYYTVEFEAPYYEVPPICPMANESSLKFNAPDGTETHEAYGKEWQWPKGTYKEPLSKQEAFGEEGRS